MTRTPNTVTWLCNEIEAAVNHDPQLFNVFIEGEIFNFHAQRMSGHWYFSLKDAKNKIDCAMWERDNLLVNFTPKDGDKVWVIGNISFYKPQGHVQLTIKRMKLSGNGDLLQQLQDLKNKLYSEGLFAQEHKKPIPKYPERIALVTGAVTHARADVLTTLARRWPVAKIQEYSCLVQGVTASADIIRALLEADQSDADVILLVRGGGSMEDLWCFNDEKLARTIYDFHTPVITGVGHEPDTTLVDYVSDSRAPTPTGAAELCSPDIREVIKALNDTKERLIESIENEIETDRLRIEQCEEKSFYHDPGILITEKRMRLDYLDTRFHHSVTTINADTKNEILHYAMSLKDSLKAITSASNAETMHKESRLHQAFLSAVSKERNHLNLTAERFKNQSSRILERETSIVSYQQVLLKKHMDSIFRKEENSLLHTTRLLDAFSPLKIMERGYSIVSKDKETIHSTDSIAVNDTVSLRFYEGSAEARITEIKEGNNHGNTGKNL